MTKPKRYKRYSAEFKREAIRRSTEEGSTDKAVARSWGSARDNFGAGEMNWRYWVMMRFRVRVEVEMRS